MKDVFEKVVIRSKADADGKITGGRQSQVPSRLTDADIHR